MKRLACGMALSIALLAACSSSPSRADVQAARGCAAIQDYTDAKVSAVAVRNEAAAMSPRWHALSVAMVAYLDDPVPQEQTILDQCGKLSDAAKTAAGFTTARP